MYRLVVAAGCAGLVLAGVACGSAALPAQSSTDRASGTDTGGGAGRGGGGTRGELVRVGAGTLILNTTSGDVTVAYTDATTVLKTSTAALGDIQPGNCITAVGRRDAAGVLTITQVSLSNPVNGSCAPAGRGPGQATPAASGAPTPDPSRSPRPGGQNAAGVRGLVKAVAGTSVTITPMAGGFPGGTSGGTSSSSNGTGDQTITIPTTVTVSRTTTGALGDLAVGDCVAAQGQKDSSGTVAARALSIQPAGPSGCFTGGRGAGFPAGGGVPGGGAGTAGG